MKLRKSALTGHTRRGERIRLFFKECRVNRRLIFTLVVLFSVDQYALLFAQDEGHSGNSAVTHDRTNTHSIIGILLDPSGAAIAKAQVTLLGTDAQAITRTTSSMVGAFRLHNVAPGRYTLELHAEGFRDTRIDTTVTLSSRSSPIRIVMPISVQTGNITVVTGAACN
jgi:hypothetical protein